MDSLFMFDVTPINTLLYLVVPLLVTFIGQRLYLHFINVNTDLYLFGHNVHHFFVGAVMAIPAAFVLAFRPEAPWLTLAALAVLGSGSSMMLDELVYLIATDGSNASYLKPVSLWGAIIAIGAAVILLVTLYFLFV